MTGPGDRTTGLTSPGAGTVALTLTLVLTLTSSEAVLSQDLIEPQTIQTELAALVDLPDTAARHQAADVLSRRRDISLEQWLVAMGNFGAFQAQQPGVQRHVVQLDVLGETEGTELFVYVPQSYDPNMPAPLLVMGHGSGSSGRGQHRMWQGIAEQLGMLVLCPSEASGNRGWAFTPRERRSVLAALRWTRREFNVDENRIFCSGISRGGHMTWDIASRHPDIFAAIAPMIGGLRLNTAEAQNNLRYLENLVHMPIRDLQGSQDDPLLLSNLHLGFERLQELGADDAELFEFPDLGHSFEMDAVDWVELFGSKRRNPTPAGVVRLAAREDEARSFWVEILRFEREVEEEFRPRVQADEWNGLDDAGRRVLVSDQALERTARLQVTMTEPGVFTAQGRGVRRFRLLLTEQMFEAGEAVEVRFNGRTKRIRPRPHLEVLLADFVERFDRTFLPAFEVIVP